MGITQEKLQGQKIKKQTLAITIAHDCKVKPKKEKKIIIIFSLFNYGKKRAGIISRFEKHTLLFSRQKRPEMIDRSKTLTTISRNKNYEGKAQQ